MCGWLFLSVLCVVSLISVLKRFWLLRCVIVSLSVVVGMRLGKVVLLVSCMMCECRVGLFVRMWVVLVKFRCLVWVSLM